MCCYTEIFLGTFFGFGKLYFTVNRKIYQLIFIEKENQKIIPTENSVKNEK